MASSVATPLERQFSTIAGVATMSSTSSLGATNITLEFDQTRNIDAASVDVQAALLRVLQERVVVPVGEATPVLFGGATTQQGLRACGLTHRLTIETTLDAVVRFPVEQGGISGRTTTFG